MGRLSSNPKRFLPPSFAAPRPKTCILHAYDAYPEAVVHECKKDHCQEQRVEAQVRFDWIIQDGGRDQVSQMELRDAVRLHAWLAGQAKSKAENGQEG